MASADELILKMQHLQAHARASIESRALKAGMNRLATAAQKLAWQSQKEVTECELIVEKSEARLTALKAAGLTGAQAGEYLAIKSTMEDARKRLVRSRAKLDFALERMLEAERREFLAFNAEVRAQAHADLAEDPLFTGKPSGP